MADRDSLLAGVERLKDLWIAKRVKSVAPSKSFDEPTPLLTDPKEGDEHGN